MSLESSEFSVMTESFPPAQVDVLQQADVPDVMPLAPPVSRVDVLRRADVPAVMPLAPPVNGTATCAPNSRRHSREHRNRKSTAEPQEGRKRKLSLLWHRGTLPRPRNKRRRQQRQIQTACQHTRYSAHSASLSTDVDTDSMCSAGNEATTT